MDTSNHPAAQNDVATSSHTPDRMTAPNTRIEVITRGERRRSWTEDQKREIAQETFAPGASVWAVARKHEISTSLLYTWRKQLRSGELGGEPQFLRVVETADGRRPEQVDTPGTAAVRETRRSAELIEVVLPSGVWVRVGARADLAMLRHVLAMLVGR